MLKDALVKVPILIRPNFTKPFVLDVDCSIQGMGVFLSQKEGKTIRVVAYASKGMSPVQRKFHAMEGECYALIWGIMHFRQYLHHNRFTLRMDHKPLEWLATLSNAYGKKGRWINMLQDFSFKILHCSRSKHTNVDAMGKKTCGVC